ncbi:expressed unknown protein [Seminavis robusta]|uniref:Uncharacterized protein n=1 Tax=Seminavis robusta TaxID=568900 RepID=A0A9N8HB18_9STRA|nr:expressed unknown protein [Seminavis robusta]|eukprot:Sro167_g074500.1 n/a (193) ;mRNA; r:58579-59157
MTDHAISNAQSEYVGLNPSPTRPQSSSPGAAPLPESRIQTYVTIAVLLLLIRLLYEFHKPLAFLALVLFGIIGAYRLNTQSNQAIAQHDARMDRINREREESEAMVAEAARMMLEINRRHLEEFIITHPDSSYEQWIGNLHPENAVDETTIDHRFYVEDSDHRLLWNELIGEERQFVPVRTLKTTDIEAAGN